MFNKRAEIGYREIFAVIFVLIFAVLWISFQNYKFKPAQDQFFDSEACRLSVIKSSIPTQGAKSLDDLQGCKPIEITTEETDSEMIYTNLANSISSCWYKFGQGKVPFRSRLGSDARYNLCLRCSKFTFAEDLEDVNRESFEAFMSENPSLNKVNKLALFDRIEKDDEIYTVFLTGRFELQEFLKEFENREISKNENLFENVDSWIKKNLLGLQGVDNSIVLLVPKEQIGQCLSLR